MSNPTEDLLTELQTIDDREDRILDVLLRHGAALEESERRMNMVSVGDLRALRDGLSSLEGVIDKLQADVATAEAAATPALPSAANSAKSNGQTEPAAAQPAAAAPEPNPSTAATTPAAAAPVPLPAMTFEQLEARIRKNDEEAAQVKEILRDRLLALGSTPHEPGTPLVPGTPVAPSPLGAPTIAAPTPGVPDITFRLSNPPMKSDEIKRFQRELNRRFEKWGINVQVREDGTYGKATRHAARQVLLGLGVSPAEYDDGITPRLRMLVLTPSMRTPLEREQAKARRPWLKRLRAREAVQPKRDLKRSKHPASSKPKGTSTAPAASVAAAIRSHGGRYEDIIVREAKRQGLPIALVCAVVQTESEFTNVFGHDPVRNPIKSPAGRSLTVTEATYTSYLKHRKAGLGCQGVGPMQLTSSGLQDRADALGGCWTPAANIRVGCEFLAGNIKRLSSKRQGIRAYNGSGPAAERYATKVLEREAAWAKRLAAATTTVAAKPKPGHAPAKGGVKGAPRTFKLTKKPLSGNDVKRFQRDLNKRFEIWKIHSRISEDGHYGATTRQAARQVLTGLGIASADFEGGVTPPLRSKIRNPSLRTPAEVARAKSREAYVAKLRKKLNGKGGGALRLRAYAEAKRLSDRGVREVGGNNRGAMVMEIIKGNGGPGPEAWCGDFVAWCYRKAGSKAVTRQWASVRAVGGLGGVKRTKQPLKGDLVRLRFDHIGMFVCWCDSRGKEVGMGAATHIKTIEGNTGRSGSVSDSKGGGDGVYTKLRARGLVSDFLHIAR